VSQPSDPYAPPQALDAVEGESNAPTMVPALRRAALTYALWLLGWSSSSSTALFVLRDHPLDRLGGDNLAKDLIQIALLNANGPRIAALAACQAAVVFAHHHRAARPKAMWTIFGFSPAGVPIALLLAYFAGAMVTQAPRSTDRLEFFAMLVRDTSTPVLLLAIAGAGLYAAILAPLAVSYLPFLTRSMPRVWQRFVVVWFSVALVTASVDWAIGRGAMALFGH
jgi:hypothetical protein